MKKRHPADEQLRALRAELEALAPEVPHKNSVAYVALGTAPIGMGDGGLY